MAPRKTLTLEVPEVTRIPRKEIRVIAHTKTSIPRFMGKRAPSVPYDDELADYIIEQIAMGRSLLEICREPNTPSAAAVIYWATKNICGFSKKYQDACIIRANIYAEELLEIVDDGRNDWVERQDQNGKTYVALDHEHVARSTLRAHTRKWVISKLLSGVYGESTQLRLADAEGKKLVAPPPMVIQPVAPPKTINEQGHDLDV